LAAGDIWSTGDHEIEILHRLVRDARAKDDIEPNASSTHTLGFVA
jgi:hypothetical protein